MLSCGDDLHQTSTSQKGSASRDYVIGVGHLVWMVSFDWSFIVQLWTKLRPGPFNVLLCILRRPQKLWRQQTSEHPRARFNSLSHLHLRCGNCAVSSASHSCWQQRPLCSHPIPTVHSTPPLYSPRAQRLGWTRSGTCPRTQTPPTTSFSTA